MEKEAKTLKDDEVFTQGEILSFIRNHKSSKPKLQECECAFIALSYLSAGRVSEIVNRIKVKHISYDTLEDEEKRIRKFMTIRLPYTLKNKKHPARILVSPIDKEAVFVEFIENYIKIDKLNRDDVMFPFSRVKGWKIIKKATGERHHWLRHCRISHLISLYNYNEAEIMRNAGWSNTKPLSTYAHLMKESYM